MDNLFISICLLAELRRLGIGAAGIVQTTKIKREEQEESTQIKAESQISGISNEKCTSKSNRGLNQSITDIKIRHNTKVPWGTLYAEVSHTEPSILQFA